MADIELVIKIPKEIYNHTQKYEVGGFNRENDTKLFMAIKNGTPLPKGHGRLTDLDELINFTYNTYGINSGKCMTKDNEDIIDYIYNKAETIIEADTKSGEQK